MPLIHLTTFIAAPAERVFDLSRSVSLHRGSMSRYAETIVAGKQEGLLENGETVTWKARHYGKSRIMKVSITSLSRPHSFIDEQVEGDFNKMKHEHFFKQVANGCIMIDQFHFETPYGILGKVAEAVHLTAYMKRLLEARNAYIKQVAETNAWKQYLS